jgi:hypothetical protein
MNVYFLVEGRRTEKKIYPKWLSHLVPELTKVDFFEDVKEFNYKLFSGFGFPHLLHKHLRSSVEEVNESGNYDYFVICLDADESSVTDMIDEVNSFMNQEGITLIKKTKLVIIVQNRTIESWLLGNPRIYKRNPTKSTILKELIAFYNVATHDPELMLKEEDFEGSIGDYHFLYLREYLLERNISYSKEYPREVTEEYYLNELIKRNTSTSHLASFKYFLDFCKDLRRQILDKKAIA